MLLRQKLIFTYLFAALSLALAFGVVGFLSVRQSTTLHVSEISEVALDALAAELKLEVKSRVDAVQTVLLNEIASAGRSQDASRDPFAVSADAQSEMFAVTIYRKSGGVWKPGNRLTNSKLLSTKQSPADLPERLIAWESKAARRSTESVFLMNRSLVGTQINQAQDVLVLSLVIPGSLIGEKNDGTAIVADFFQDRIRRIVLREGRSEFALLNPEGHVIIHPSIQLTAKHAESALPDLNQPDITSPASLSSLFVLKIHGQQTWARSAQLGLAGVIGVAQYPLEDYLAPWVRASQQAVASMGAVGSLFLLFFVAFALRLKLRINRMVDTCAKLSNPKSKPDFERSDDELGALGKRLNQVHDQFRAYLSEAIQIAKEQEVKVADTLLEGTSYGISPITTLAVDSETFLERCREKPGFFGETIWWGQWLGVFVGSSTSPGFSGSLTAMATRSVLLSLNQKDSERVPRPAEILGRLHQVLLTRGNGAFGLSAFLCFVNLDNGEVRVSSANHRGPLLLHRVRGKVEDLSLEGSPLGLKSRPSLQESQYEMEVGDSLLFVSPGLFDSTDTHGKILGETALSRILVEGRERGAPELKEKLTNAFRSHLGDMALTDDAAYWLLQWKRRLSEVSPPLGGKKDDEALWRQEVKPAAPQPPSFEEEAALRDALNLEAKDLTLSAEKKLEVETKKVA